jgi:hypothetical protein
MRLLLIIVLVAAVAIALVMIARPSGPRVTHIEHRRDDKEEDGDDA